MPTPKRKYQHEAESPTFKQYTSEHKAKMKVQYPFLTDIQIMGKLKNRWKDQSTPSKSPKHTPSKKREIRKSKGSKLELELFSLQDGINHSQKVNPSHPSQKSNKLGYAIDVSDKKPAGIMKSCATGSKTSKLNVSFHSPAQEFLYSQPDSLQSQGFGISEEPDTAKHDGYQETTISNDPYTMDGDDNYDDDDDDAVLIKRTDCPDDGSQEKLEEDSEEFVNRGRKRAASSVGDSPAEPDKDVGDTEVRKMKKVKMEQKTAPKSGKKKSYLREQRKVTNQGSCFDIRRDFNFDESNMNEVTAQSLNYEQDKENTLDEDDKDFQVPCTNARKKSEFGKVSDYSAPFAKKQHQTPASCESKAFDYSSPLFEELKTELAKIEAGKAPKKRRSKNEPKKLTVTSKRIPSSLSSNSKNRKKKIRPAEDNMETDEVEDHVKEKQKIVSEKNARNKRVKRKKGGIANMGGNPGPKKKNASNNMNPSGDASQAETSQEDQNTEPHKLVEVGPINVNNNNIDKMDTGSEPMEAEDDEMDNKPMSGQSHLPRGEGACNITASLQDSDSSSFVSSGSSSLHSHDYYHDSQMSTSSSTFNSQGVSKSITPADSSIQYTRGSINPALKKALSSLQSANMSISPRVVSPCSSSTSIRSSPRLLSPALSGVSEFSSASSSTNEGGRSAVPKSRRHNVPDLCGLFTDVTPPEKKTKGSYKTQRMLTSNTPESGPNVKALFHDDDDNDFLFK